MGLDMFTYLHAQEPPLSEYEQLGKHLEELRDAAKEKYIEDNRHMLGHNRPTFRFNLQDGWFSSEEKKLLIEYAKKNPDERCFKPIHKALSRDMKVELDAVDLTLKALENIKKYK